MARRKKAKPSRSARRRKKKKALEEEEALEAAAEEVAEEDEDEAPAAAPEPDEPEDDEPEDDEDEDDEPALKPLKRPAKKAKSEKKPARDRAAARSKEDAPGPAEVETRVSGNGGLIAMGIIFGLMIVAIVVQYVIQ